MAIEVGPHSRWVSQVIGECGHDAIVANASKVRFIFANNGKNDRVDARSLARLARVDRHLLFPIPTAAITRSLRFRCFVPVMHSCGRGRG